MAEDGTGNAVAWALAGPVAGALAAFVLAQAAALVLRISQVEGACAMRVVFFRMPLGAMAGLVARGVTGFIRR